MGIIGHYINLIVHSVLVDTMVDLIIAPNILCSRPMWEEGMNTKPQIYCNNNNKKKQTCKYTTGKQTKKKAS